MSGMSIEDDQQERDEVLATTIDRLHEIGDIVESVIEQGYMCVIGNEVKIEEDKAILGSAKALFK